ncbi:MULTISPECIES: response regulator [Ramlibacter]|uniref:Response regulator n=1 Tax=Ramlibacter aquaticus TaxID=2780094 RepID=A0ABR9SDG2_9BURK|nr:MULTISPECIES: response regulator [Ramlibacter]MBE7939919.1 response regulator [Ramlibacter aquaticus]
MAEPAAAAPRHILIVEDDTRLATLLSRFLCEHGFTADIVGNGLQVEPEVRRAEPALVLLDLLMPGMDGIEVCQQLRRFSSVPIIVLSARTEEIDRLLALEMGADDFVAKPYSPRELLARIKALLRRVEGRLGTPTATHGFRIDEAAQRIAWEDSWLPLTPAEYRLLRKLISRPGQVFRRADLNESEEGQAGDRVVDSHVKNLRRKIAQVRPQGSAIVSVYGLGYRFDPQSAQDAS